MTWVAAAVAGGAVVGGYLSSSGSKSAANTQANAQNQATQTQQNMFNTVVGQEQPFLNTGYGAETGLNELMGLSPGGGAANGSLMQGYGGFNAPPGFNFDPSQLSKMPGYQFQLQQGDQAVQNSDAAKTGALSGATLKDLTSFNQGLAGTYENQYFNQALSGQAQNYNQQLSNYSTNQQNYYASQNNIFNRLNQMASLGQNAAANLGNNSTQLGTGIAQSQAAQGASIAAGQMGSAQAWAGAAGQVPLAMLMSGNPNNYNNYNWGGTPSSPDFSGAPIG